MCIDQAPGCVELPLENPEGAKHPRIHLNMMASEEDRKAVRVRLFDSYMSNQEISCRSLTLLCPNTYLNHQQCLRDVRDLMAEPAMVSRGFKVRQRRPKMTQHHCDTSLIN